MRIAVCLKQVVTRESPVRIDRTGAWIEASSAVYTRPPGAYVTPMGGGTIAHADRASRDTDPLAAGGVDVPWTRLAGPGDRR